MLPLTRVNLNEWSLVGMWDDVAGVKRLRFGDICWWLQLMIILKLNDQSVLLFNLELMMDRVDNCVAMQIRQSDNQGEQEERCEGKENHDCQKTTEQNVDQVVDSHRVDSGMTAL
jgi:hypothetical protein